MRLILDFGNTYQKCAIFNGSSLIVFRQFENISLKDIISFTADFGKIDAAILSSVINTDSRIIEYLRENYFFIELNADTPTPLINKYGSPETLGRDRLSAAVGAAALFPGHNVLSIDTGTAIKFDFVNKQGEYLGGSIAPGLWLRFKALHTFTDKLPLIGYTENHPLIGNNTEESMLSGVINGAVAEVNGMIEQYKTLYPGLKIILTGGESIYFEKSIKSNIFADSKLVVKGLNEILKFNETN